MASASDKAAAKLEAALAAGDYYGALQVYRTIVKRRADAGAADEARALVVAGAQSLLRHGKPLEALDLADMLLKDLLTGAGAPLTQASLDAVLAIAGAVPRGAAVPQTLALLRGALRWAKAAVERQEAPGGKAAPGELTGADAADAVARLHAASAAAAAGGGPEFYPDASRHYLEAAAPAEFADFLWGWAGAGYAGERDLFLGRAVLQLLCLGNMRDANALREAYLAKPGASAACDTPLGHFLRFLLLTLERDAAPLFKTLADKYGRTLRERDPALAEYVTTIGTRFFHIQPPGAGNGMDAMMSSLMGMLGGGGGGGPGGPGGPNPLLGLLGGGAGAGGMPPKGGRRG